MYATYRTNATVKTWVWTTIIDIHLTVISCVSWHA